MAKNEKLETPGSKDELQGVGVRELPGSAAGAGEDEDGVWVLDTRALLPHYAHLKIRPGKSSQKCAVCVQGVGAILKTVEEAATGNDRFARMVQSARADEERDAAFARSSRASEDGDVAEPTEDPSPDVAGSNW